MKRSATFSKEALRRIRRGSLDDRVKEAVKEIEEQGVIVNVYDVYMAVISDGLVIGRNVFYNYLREKYQEELRGIDELFGSSSFGLQPILQPLREQLGLYKGNLYEAKRQYWSLEASNFDFLRNVTIPLTIDAKVAQALGIIWADGVLRHNRSNQGIVLQGRFEDFLLYKSVVRDLVKEVFNLDFEIRPYKETKNGKVPKKPVIDLISKAVVSWLVNEIGFPKNNYDKGLPKIEFTPELAAAFFKGLFMNMSIRRVKDGREHYFLNDCSHRFMTELILMSQKFFGAKPYFGQHGERNSYFLIYKPSEIEKLRRFGIIKDQVLK